MIFGQGIATRVYLAVGAVDLRKSFEGLYGLVRDQMGCDPLSGHLFLFTNARRTRLKVMVFDGSGLWVCTKRLERGRFGWPASADSAVRIEMRVDELSLLLNGIDLEQARPRKWFRKYPS
ncbi:MAG: IS66 family insertion sequence element accessory protein TnpB [Acidobacteriaceae bacterium]|nr:IS66 family insertion sequence element accessory protein TnpB [Acidobacteriaceae bacterium]